MKFLSSEIMIGKGKSLEDIAQEMFGNKEASSEKKNVKTASTKEVKKEDFKKEVVASENEEIIVEDSTDSEIEVEASSEEEIKVEASTCPEDSENCEEADSNVDEESLVESCGSKTSQNSTKYVKIANLNPKQKDFVKRYFKMIYPESYADAMVQDK